MMRIGIALVILAFLPGCLFPFGTPKFCCVPSVDLGSDADDVHVFRVDITRYFADISGDDCYTYSEVPFTFLGWTPPQIKVSGVVGIFVFGVALNYPIYVSQSVAARLYRPSYELVELDSWQLPRRVEWKMAPNLTSQEDALDQLFRFAKGGELRPATFNPISSQLNPGSASAAHRRALLFGASEYDRLAAGELASTDEARRRLHDKAEKLRQLAKE
jgi:hypothetical protein